jgi:hypothetical protein
MAAADDEGDEDDVGVQNSSQSLAHLYFRPKLDRPLRPMRVPEGEAPLESTKAAKRASRKGKGRGENTHETTPGPSRAAPPSPDDTIRPWNSSSLADSRVSKQPALFTKDGRYELAIIPMPMCTHSR